MSAIQASLLRTDEERTNSTLPAYAVLRRAVPDHGTVVVVMDLDPVQIRDGAMLRSASFPRRFIPFVPGVVNSPLGILGSEAQLEPFLSRASPEPSMRSSSPRPRRRG